MWDSSAWQSCSSATQKWKQPLSPVGMTPASAYPVLGLSRVKGLLWSEVTGLGQSRAGIVPPFCVTLGELGKLQLAVVWCLR